jgi:acetyl-CoA carboxylase biotin carboxyl carrier protein
VLRRELTPRVSAANNTRFPRLLGRAPHAKGDPLDLKELKEILQILEEKEITEFELEEEGLKLRIRKAVASSNHSAPTAVLPLHVPAVMPPLGAGPAPATTAAFPAAPASAPAPAEAAEAGLVVVKSPIVGTFYRAPDPNSPPFVNVGDRVRVGQVLCIIEAMKLMNEIEAESAGEIVKAHQESGQPVQYGDPLFTIRPE